MTHSVLLLEKIDLKPLNQYLLHSLENMTDFRKSIADPEKEQRCPGMNAYSIYRDTHWHDVSEANPNLVPTEINKIIGRMYERLTDAEKESLHSTR